MKDLKLCANVKRNIAAELIHKRRAKELYSNFTSCHKNTHNEPMSICFNHMQNLPLPHILVQEVFYLRQLWINVFCVHDLKSNKAKLYVHHEGEGNKSPNEVCSFVWHYIQNEVPNSTKKLLLFSDGPIGQSKNHTVTRFLLNLCDRHRFETTIHLFPVRGHSFSPCDRNFGSIKRMLRKTNHTTTVH